MSIDSQLAFLIMGLPLFILLSLGFGAYFVYGIDPEFISAVISTVLVILLVWERLRGSLNRDLEYLHKNVLYKLYGAFGYRDYLFYTMENSKHYAMDIQNRRNDLKRHGRFLGFILLYPPDLLTRLDEYLLLHITFYRKFQKIRDLAGKKLEIPLTERREAGILWQRFGFESETPSGFDIDQEKPYKEAAEKLLKEQILLIAEARTLHETLKEEAKQIHEKLEVFFKRNNLRLEPEPTHSPFRY